MDERIDQTLQRYAEAFSRDHRRAAEEFYTDAIVLRLPGRHPWAGEFHGREAVAGALQAIIGATDGTLAPLQFLGAAFGDGLAFVHLRMGATRTGQDFAWDRAISYRFSDGRIAEITTFEYDLHGVDAFFQL